MRLIVEVTNASKCLARMDDRGHWDSVRCVGVNGIWSMFVQHLVHCNHDCNDHTDYHKETNDKGTTNGNHKALWHFVIFLKIMFVAHCCQVEKCYSLDLLFFLEWVRWLVQHLLQLTVNVSYRCDWLCWKPSRSSEHSTDGKRCRPAALFARGEFDWTSLEFDTYWLLFFFHEKNITNRLSFFLRQHITKFENCSRTLRERITPSTKLTQKFIALFHYLSKLSKFSPDIEVLLSQHNLMSTRYKLLQQQYLLLLQWRPQSVYIIRTMSLTLKKKTFLFHFIIHLNTYWSVSGNAA